MCICYCVECLQRLNLRKCLWLIKDLRNEKNRYNRRNFSSNEEGVISEDDEEVTNSSELFSEK